ncbi:hypothetical protein ACP70R_038164 [Stipagrostis hirtigluma subsp. patula]
MDESENGRMTFPSEEEHHGTGRMDEHDDEHGEGTVAKRPRVEDEEAQELEHLIEFRRFWDENMKPHYGPVDATTAGMGPMRYTDSGPPRFGGICYNALEILSLRVTELKEGLEWPIRVYGIVAVRDSMDHRRNLLFDRSEENCQILTAKDSSLLLIGPSRAIALIDPPEFEIELRVLGSMPSDKKILSAVYFEYGSNRYRTAHAGLVMTRTLASKRSTMELKYCHLTTPLEATIEIWHTEGSIDFNGRFFAYMEYMGEDDIVLLDFRDHKVTLKYDGQVLLSRRVVLVEEGKELILGVKAWKNGDVDSAVEKRVAFPSRFHSKSDGSFDVGFCRMSIIVAWSVLC